MDDNLKKLSDEEEALLREFEEERSRARSSMNTDIREELKQELAEQVKESMEMEMKGGVEQQVKQAFESAVDIEVEKALSVEDMKKQIEAEVRKKIEDETRERLKKEMEENIRKEVEEREKGKKDELLKKIQAFKYLEDEMRQEQEKDAKEKEKLIEELKQKESALKETDPALREKLKEELKKELEEERLRKKEELLRKIETAKEQSKKEESNKPGFSQNEKVTILQIFEESQNVMNSILSARLSKKEVDSVFYDALLRALDRHPAVLKRVMYDKTGNPMPGGMLNTSRLIANTDMLEAKDEEQRAPKMFEALRAVFEERLAMIEKLTSADIRNKIALDTLNHMKKSMSRKGYGIKTESIFIKQIFPSVLPGAR
ncbi:MAG TPA: hypothetical protein ENN43_00025 [bacterium]|nr:hypothetical protein [bacterium]